ncbi:Agmatine/putrescine antiporter, associated with agmatine catabolism [Vibrio chagasii]|nr:Agmatine/putrescine antiporter, associated with agmatine catabolism [Vibrio chagasii]
MENNDKKIGLFETVLFGVCTVLVIDTVAASASVGVGGFVWWVALLICFFLPYGLVTAELSTTFPQDGGIYDWIKRAYGREWGARTAWIYWINFALWIPAVYYLFAVVGAQILNVEITPWQTAGISIAMSWVAVWLSMKPIAEASWIPNLGAACKVIVMSAIGIAGIAHLVQGNPTANGFALSDFAPDINTGLELIPIALFGLVGFEVVGGAAGALKDPAKDIPKATILGGILIAFFYLLASFGILTVIPVDEINASAGLYESLEVLFGTTGIMGMLINGLAICFMFTLISNIVSWSVGVNYVARYAALNNDMPSSFKTVNENGVAKGAAIWNGVVSTVVMVIYGLIATYGGNEDLFWNVFSLGAVTLLMSYIIMFPAFLKLRKTDDTPRPYRVKGNDFVIKLACYSPMVCLILGVITFFWTPAGGLDPEFLVQVGLGVIISLVIGEVTMRQRLKAEDKS